MKLSPLTYFLIALSVGLIALSWAYFQQFAPNMQSAQYHNENADKLQIEADKMPLAKKRVEKAISDVKDIAGRWQNVVAQHTPSQSVQSGGIDLSVNAWQLTVDSRFFRNNIQRAVNAQMKRGGIRVVQGPTIPMPSENATDILASFYNYPAISFPVCIFDLGQVTVAGTFEQIVKNVESWSDMPNYLAVADGLQLTGTSPNLIGTYNVSLVAYIRGKEIHPAVPEAGGSGQTPNFGGGGGSGPAPNFPGPQGTGGRAAGANQAQERIN